MTVHRLWGLGLALWAGQAWALSQDRHHQLTLDACVAAGFPVSSCREIAVANHNTDAHEWENLAAHSQLPVESTVCEGVNQSALRLRELGAGTRLDLAEQADPSRTPEAIILSARRALSGLGRALHTVQDNCAHSGMPNPQHAWFSVSDMCLDTASSPDIREEAVDCAEHATAEVFAAFRRTLDELGVAPHELYQGDTIARTQKLWPLRSGLCAFVRSPREWDGIDRGWDNAFVMPRLLSQLDDGLAGSAALAPDACTEPPELLALKDPQPPVETRPFNLTCQAVEAVCSGNPDGRDEVPPWESDLAQVLSSACTSAPGAWPAALGLLVVLGALRRRRR